MDKRISTVLKGFAVGASMSVPGVSGGTMAMILGVYDKLLESVSRVFREPKQRIPFLLMFSLGGAAGVFLAAGLIARALDSAAGVPLRFAFLGAVAGGIPLIFRKAELRTLSVKSALLILAGALSAALMGLLPEGLFELGGGGAAYAAVQLVGGLFVAAALVLPGISASHIMYVLGIYESAANSLARADFLSLAPLAAGVLAGTFLTARLLERLLERHRRGSFLVILGFMTASLCELVPKGADAVQLLIGAVCAAAGFVAVRALCGREEKSAA